MIHAKDCICVACVSHREAIHTQGERCGHNFMPRLCPYPHCGYRKALEKLDAINTPELIDFQKAVVLEAQHQRLRWSSEHDAGKEPQDWFWLLGYLAGKALKAHADGNTEKALHHTISSAAALANWHAAILGKTNMRPGIDPAEKGIGNSSRD